MEYVPYSVWKGQGSSLEKENIWLIVVNSWDLITSFETPLSLVQFVLLSSLDKKVFIHSSVFLVDKFQSPIELAFDQYFQPKKTN